MGDPVGGDGFHARVAENDLVVALRRGISVVGGFHVAHEQLPDIGNGLQQFERDPVGDLLAGHGILTLALRIVHEAPGHFLSQADVDGVHQSVHVEGHVLRYERFGAEVAGKAERQQVLQDSVDPFPGRQVLAVDTVQAAERVVGLHNPGRNGADLAACFGHGHIDVRHQLLFRGLIAS